MASFVDFETGRELESRRDVCDQPKQPTGHHTSDYEEFATGGNDHSSHGMHSYLNLND